MSKKISMPKKRIKLPSFFVSYSSREAHLQVLFLSLWILFKDKFHMQRTPTALQSGVSQLTQITELINSSDFAIVVLDGLRPNVIFEYGLLRATDKPTIVLKEKNAVVDLEGYSLTAGAPTPVKLSVDSHLSNIKDINYAEWDRLDPQATLHTISAEYEKKRDIIENYQSLIVAQLWK
jgi:hypothetical protein